MLGFQKAALGLFVDRPSLLLEGTLRQLTNFVEAMLELDFTDHEDFKSRDRLNELVARLEGIGHEVRALDEDEEHGGLEIVAVALDQGHREYTVSDELMLTGEYRQLRTLYPHMKDLGSGEIEVANGDQRVTVSSRQDLLDRLLEEGRRGVALQRYKGLGEMNPDQLWETTMDPSKRQLLRVSVNDQVDADNVFTVLMGDAVAPRRQFIEENALEVRNLDV